MRLTFRAKLLSLVAIAASALLIVVVASSLMAERANAHILSIQERFLPRIGLQTELDSRFERLRRALQDAVAASDPEQLAAAAQFKEAMEQPIAQASTAIDPGVAENLRHAVDEYYATAEDISKRLIRGETGEKLSQDLEVLPTRQERVERLIVELAAFDRRELAAAFLAAHEAQRTATHVRLLVSAACLLLVIGLSMSINRTLLQSLANLTAGFERFGRGDFSTPIPIVTHDEIGDVSARANRMAASLQSLESERGRVDWVKTGVAGLGQELRGELEPVQAADRAVAYVARYLEAPVGALYAVDGDETLLLLGRYALGGDGEPVPEFRVGEGIVGQAARSTELTVVAADQAGTALRFRSGTTEGTPCTVACLPLVSVGRVTGVLEVGLLQPWSPRASEFLLAIRETVTISVEVARSRASLRRLLAETQEQAERLAIQEEALRRANAELQAKQAELQTSNEELANKAEELQAKQVALEEKNVALQDARKRLEEKAVELTTASTYKSQFLANMSHELRTPLNAIIGFAELLHSKEVPPDAPEHNEFLGDILTSGQHLLRLINDILDLSKVEAGKLEFRPEPIDLQRAVGEVLAILRTTAAEKRIKVESQVDPSIGEVVLDPSRFKQVLYNYMSNALKFTPEGGRVTVRVLGEGSEGMRLEVEDTGIGIADKDLDRLFGEFQQIHSAGQMRQGGTGLGLALTKRLVEAQAGSVGVRSQLGKGSLFYAILPRRSGGGRKPAPPTPPPAPVRSEGPSILVVEDDPNDQRILVDALAHAGYSVEVASTGNEAVAKCRETAYDAITLDLLLPDLNGIEVLRQLRANGKNARTPVVVVTVVAEQGSLAGFAVTDILRKPAVEAELVGALERAGVTPGPHAKVLVVDDDPGALKLMTAAVRRLGMDTACERDPARALAHALDSPPAAIVLDLLMPGMDGFEFLDRLRGQPAGRTVPVIVWSVLDLTPEQRARLKASAQAVVSKGHGGPAAVVAQLEALLQPPAVQA